MDISNFVSVQWYIIAKRNKCKGVFTQYGI